MRRSGLILVLLSYCCAGQVRFQHQTDRVSVTVNGRPLGSLYFGKDANKPFFHPLTTPGGITVTRAFPLQEVAGEPHDHPHQKGLWMGTERLSGMDLWENDSSYKRPRMGKIVFKDVSRMAAGPKRGELGFRADWLSPEGELLITEDRTMTFYADATQANVIDVDATFTAHEAVTFEDHQDAVIGTRLRPAFDEKNGGMAINAEGFRGEAGVRGRASKYVDWRATVDGKLVGVAILDHPRNLNAPARWHIRSFGFFTANPFARQAFDPAAPSASHTMKPGETLHLRYRVIVYQGAFDVEASWKEFAASPAASAGTGH